MKVLKYCVVCIKQYIIYTDCTSRNEIEHACIGYDMHHWVLIIGVITQGYQWNWRLLPLNISSSARCMLQ